MSRRRAFFGKRQVWREVSEGLKIKRGCTSLFSLQTALGLWPGANPVPETCVSPLKGSLDPERSWTAPF